LFIHSNNVWNSCTERHRGGTGTFREASWLGEYAEERPCSCAISYHMLDMVSISTDGLGQISKEAIKAFTIACTYWPSSPLTIFDDVNTQECFWTIWQLHHRVNH
jgi:hypothetical protein